MLLKRSYSHCESGMLYVLGCLWQHATGQPGENSPGGGIVKTFRQLIMVSIVQWLPLAALAVLVLGVAGIAQQQNYRSSANDPQVQMATDARLALVNGASPQSLVPAHTVDLAQSLAPFLIIYDASGSVVASSASLAGQTPTLPHGVLDSAKSMDMDMLTWQPAPGVRSAIVVQHYDGGYVLAGRSLTQVEIRENDLNHQYGVGLAGTLIGTFLVVLFTVWLKRRMPAEMQ